MKKRTVITILLFAFFVGLLSVNIEVEAVSQVPVLSSTGYIASTGSYYIVGEVKNNGNTAMNYVKVTATYYDNTNTVVATDFTFTELDLLLPNAKSPFKIILIDKNQASKVDHYALTTSYDIASSPPSALKILSQSFYIGSTGSFRIVGEVQNTGGLTSSYTKIVATLYDSNGEVTGEDFTFSDPMDIQAGEKAPFEVIYIEYSRVPLVQTYSLIAESSLYSDLSSTTTSSFSPEPSFTSQPTFTTTPTLTSATPETSSPTPSPSVPEFPTFAAIPILMATLLAGLLIYKKRPKMQTIK